MPIPISFMVVGEIMDGVYAPHTTAFSLRERGCMSSSSGKTRAVVGLKEGLLGRLRALRQSAYRTFTADNGWSLG